MFGLGEKKMILGLKCMPSALSSLAAESEAGPVTAMRDG